MVVEGYINAAEEVYTKKFTDGLPFPDPAHVMERSTTLQSSSPYESHVPPPQHTIPPISQPRRIQCFRFLLSICTHPIRSILKNANAREGPRSHSLLTSAATPIFSPVLLIYTHSIARILKIPNAQGGGPTSQPSHKCGAH